MFFRNDDPLETWLLYATEPLPAAHMRVLQDQLRQGLDNLAAMLDDPDPKRRRLTESGISSFRVAPLRAGDVSRAQELYRRVYTAGGNGVNWVQEGLLGALGLTADPGAVPFWVEVLELNRPREQFAPTRRRFAVAALAFLAIRRGEPAAYETLRALARRFPNPDVRALAVEYLKRAYLEADRPVPPEVLDEMRAIATEDTAFTPRFQARRFLQAVDAPLPLDNPGGAYAFKVKFKYAKRIYRTIELRSEQTLADLSNAFQYAINWDNDHLYSFYMTGKRDDRRYEIPLTDPEAGFGMFPFAPQLAAEEDDAEGPLLAGAAVIGELGLPLKHKFMYFFDYGDSHEFEVEVVGIRREAAPGEYPRVVDAGGKAPPQYRYPDYDGSEEWEGGDPDWEDPED